MQCSQSHPFDWVWRNKFSFWLFSTAVAGRPSIFSCYLISITSMCAFLHRQKPAEQTAESIFSYVLFAENLFSDEWYLSQTVVCSCACVWVNSLIATDFNTWFSNMDRTEGQQNRLITNSYEFLLPKEMVSHVPINPFDLLFQTYSLFLSTVSYQYMSRRCTWN